MGETFDFDKEIVIGLENQNNKKKNIHKEQVNKSNTTKNEKSNKFKKKNKNSKLQEERVKSNKVRKKVPKVLSPEQERKRKRFCKIIKISAIIIIIVVVIVLTMFSPLFNIKEINVSGNSKLSSQTIISLSEVVEGENTYKINKGKVENKIKEGNAYIENVQIKRILPSTLEIQIEERVATFMLEYGGGYVYLNDQGYMLEISNEKLEVPTIQGTHTLDEDIKVGGRLCNEDLKEFSIILKIIESANQVGISNLISKIDISNDQDYKVIFETEQKTAHLGDKTNITNKMEFIKLFIEDEKAVPGEIFVNIDLNKRDPYFRQQI